MKIKEPHIRWTGIPILGFIMTFIVKHETPEPFWYDLLVATAFTTVYWNGAVLVMKYYIKRFPSIKATPKRLILSIGSILVFLLVAGVIMKLLLGYARFDQLTDLAVILDHFGSNVGAAVFVGSVYESVHFFGQWKKTIQINEALKNQQIRTQFEVLQNQMSPHFLFNSLNTLTTLIAENPGVAMEFTQKLSEVYRYILQNKDKELVTLEEELEFAEAYIFLLKMRYPENLRTAFHIDNGFKNKYIAPLTIQMLVENAIKHNVVSKAHPLSIEVYVENGYSIVVKNNLQRKKVIQKSTKTGLENIKKRYQYFGDKPVDIIVTTQNFMVAVPLINLIHERSQPLAV